MVTHYGFAASQKTINETSLIQHFCKVNGVTETDFHNHLNEAKKIWQDRNRVEWDVQFEDFDKYVNKRPIELMKPYKGLRNASYLVPYLEEYEVLFIAYYKNAFDIAVKKNKSTNEMYEDMLEELVTNLSQEQIALMKNKSLSEILQDKKVNVQVTIKMLKAILPSKQK